MKLNNVKDIQAFMKVLDMCRGQVWLESAEGDRFDLKSLFSRYVAIGNLLEDHNDKLLLYASDYNDEVILMNFLKELEEEN